MSTLFFVIGFILQKVAEIVIMFLPHGMRLLVLSCLVLVLIVLRLIICLLVVCGFSFPCFYNLG